MACARHGKMDKASFQWAVVIAVRIEDGAVIEWLFSQTEPVPGKYARRALNASIPYSGQMGQRQGIYQSLIETI